MFTVSPADGERLLREQPVPGITLARIGEIVAEGYWLERDGRESRWNRGATNTRSGRVNRCWDEGDRWDAWVLSVPCVPHPFSRLLLHHRDRPGLADVDQVAVVRVGEHFDPEPLGVLGEVVLVPLAGLSISPCVHSGFFDSWANR